MRRLVRFFVCAALGASLLARTAVADTAASNVVLSTAGAGVPGSVAVAAGAPGFAVAWLELDAESRLTAVHAALLDGAGAVTVPRHEIARAGEEEFAGIVLMWGADRWRVVACASNTDRAVFTWGDLALDGAFTERGRWTAPDSYGMLGCLNVRAAPAGDELRVAIELIPMGEGDMEAGCVSAIVVLGGAPRFERDRACIRELVASGDRTLVFDAKGPAVLDAAGKRTAIKMPKNASPLPVLPAASGGFLLPYSVWSKKATTHFVQALDPSFAPAGKPLKLPLPSTPFGFVRFDGLPSGDWVFATVTTAGAAVWFNHGATVGTYDVGAAKPILAPALALGATGAAIAWSTAAAGMRGDIVVTFAPALTK